MKNLKGFFTKIKEYKKSRILKNFKMRLLYFLDTENHILNRIPIQPARGAPGETKRPSLYLSPKTSSACP